LPTLDSAETLQGQQKVGPVRNRHHASMDAY